MKTRSLAVAVFLVAIYLLVPALQWPGGNEPAAWGYFQAGKKAGKKNTPTLRAKVLGWVRDNIKSENPKFIKSINESIDEALQARVDFSFTFGSKSVKDGKAKLFHVFGGGFYPFTLTGAQARQALSDPGSVTISKSGPVKYQRQEPLSARLTKANIDDDKSLEGTSKVTGEVQFETLKELPPKTNLRLTYRVGITTVAHFTPRYHDGTPPAKGKVSFSFSPMNESKDTNSQDRAKGPVVVFLDVCTINNTTGEVQVLSNTLARLVNVR